MRRLLPVTDMTAAETEGGTAAGPDAAGPGAGGRGSAGPAAAAASAAASGPGYSASGREWSLDELADAYAYPALPAGEGAWLRANMVSSLDGAGQHDGRSQPLSSDADMRIFGTLRGLADVVVVGAETVRLEGYRPARAREAFAARRAAADRAPPP